MKTQYFIRTGEGVLLGTVEIDADDIPVFDLALTPIVQIAKDEAPSISGFLASPRTELDIRKREQKWPYRHLGVVVTSGSRPDETETEEFIGKERDDYDRAT